MAYNYGLNEEEQQNLRSGGLLPGYSQMDVQKARTTTQRQQPRVDAYTGAARVPRQRMQDVPIDGRTGAARKMPAATGLPKPQGYFSQLGNKFAGIGNAIGNYTQELGDVGRQQGGGARGVNTMVGKMMRDAIGGGAGLTAEMYKRAYTDVLNPPVQSFRQNVSGPFVDALTGNTQPPPTDANVGAGAMGPQASAPGAAPQESYTLQTPVSRGLAAMPDMSAANFQAAGIGPQPLENAAYGQGAPGITRMVQGGQTRYDTPQGYADFQGLPAAQRPGGGALIPGQAQGWQRIMGAGQPGGLPAGGGYSGAATDAEALARLQARGIDTTQRDAFGNVRMPVGLSPETDQALSQARFAAADRGDFGGIARSYRTPEQNAAMDRQRRLEQQASYVPNPAYASLGDLAKAQGQRRAARGLLDLDVQRQELAGEQGQAQQAAQQAAQQQDFENRLAMEQFGLSREQAEFGQKRDVANLNRGLAKDRMEAAKESYSGMLRQGLMERLQDPLANEETVSAYLNSSLGAISKMMGEPVYMYQGNIVSQSDIADTAKREDIKARAKQAGVKPEEFVMNLLREQGLYSPSAAPAQ